MTEENTASGGGNDAPVSEGELTFNHALKELVDERNKSPAESAEPATAENELSGEDNAGPETAPGENEGTDPEEKLPPVERPRSWSKDDDDEWNAIPRDRQEKIAAKELAREADINQRINKAAETTKAAEAKVAEAEQVRQQYEAKLADQMQVLLEHNNQQFAAIKKQEDVDFLANEALRLSQSTDPGERDLSRQYTAFLNAWQVHQQKMALKKVELDQVEGRKATERQTEARDRKSRENALLIKEAPEYADAAKLDAAQKAAAVLFREKGFTDEQLQNLVAENPVLDDHRMQLIVDDARKFRDIQKAKAAVAKTPVPPVQRPGTSKPSGSANSERVQALDSKLTNTGRLDDAFAALVAQRNSERRAS